MWRRRAKKQKIFILLAFSSFYFRLKRLKEANETKKSWKAKKSFRNFYLELSEKIQEFL